MAVTVISNEYTQMVPKLAADVKLSGLTAAATETIPYPTANRTAECPLKRVYLSQVNTEATSGDPVLFGYWAADDSNNQYTVKFDTVAGGDLTGAVVTIRVEFDDQAQQDGQSINSDNEP